MQAGLSLCWSHIPNCWKSHVMTQLFCVCLQQRLWQISAFSHNCLRLRCLTIEQVSKQLTLLFFYMISVQGIKACKLYIYIFFSVSGYANTLLTAAKSLYAFAKNHKGIYSQSVSQASNFYGYVSYSITE